MSDRHSKDKVLISLWLEKDLANKLVGLEAEYRRSRT
jgi:hypothetical protein